MFQFDPDPKAAWEPLAGVDGVEILRAPDSRQATRQAGAAFGRALKGGSEDDDGPESVIDAFDAFRDTYVRAVVLGWRGIADPKKRPLPFTQAALNAALQHNVLGPALQALAEPHLERLLAKNASAPASPGTSSKATAASNTAKRSVKSHTAPKTKTAAKAAPTAKPR